MNDHELLRDYIENRSEAAFTELVRRHLDIVYSAALRRVHGDPHRAEDVVQTVFADLARKAASLAEHPALIGWLYTSTYFAAAKTMRAAHRQQSRDQKVQVMNELLADSPAPVDWNELRPVLDDALHDLNERERTALVLRFFEQCSMAELGARLGLSERGARKRMDRALENLRARLSRRGITSTSAALTTVLASQTVNAAPAGLVNAVSHFALSPTSAATAATGGALATLTLLTSMSTAKITILAGLAGLSLTANALLVVGLRDRGILFSGSSSSTMTSASRVTAPATGKTTGAPALAAQAGNLPDSAEGAGGAPKAGATTFDQLMSKDPATFAANLRAMGFPTSAIRGSITALMNELLLPRRLEVLGSVPLPAYWETTGSLAPTGAQVAAFARLHGELDKTMRDLFPEDKANYLLNLRRNYGNLPPEKLEQLDAIQMDYSQMQTQFRGAMLPWETDGYALLEKERQKDIEAALTPAELEEYNFRVSPVASALRELPMLNLNEEEFRALYGLQSGAAAKSATTPAASQEINAQIKAALGDQRYADYQRATDPSFQQAYSLTQRLNLPPANAVAVYDLQRDISNRAVQLRSAPDLTPEKRTAEINQLTQEANQQLTTLLTPTGLETYKRSAGSWLRTLESPPTSVTRRP